MVEAFAVTGYLSATLVKGLKPHSSGSVDVRVQRDRDDVFIRVRLTDVKDVRIGATQKKFTLVQLILVDDAVVESVTVASAKTAALTPFYDPIVHRLTPAATAKMILV